MRWRSLFFLLAFFACFAGNSPAQSGRSKPSPTPTPRSISGPSVATGPQTTPTPTIAASPQTKKQDDDIIKVDSVLVPIPVHVTEPDGRPVRTLKLGDLELKVDGKRVEIAELVRSELPIRLAMLFDNSSSVLIAREFEKEAAVRFFKRVIRPDRDMAALFSVADYTRLEEPLTRDISLLARAIDLFPEPKGATALLDGIIKVAEYLKSTNGRRVIVIVSDGEDTYSDLRTMLDDVVRSLQVSDCQVYVVRTKDFENMKRTGLRAGNANIRTLAAERRMLEITQQTGGAVYSPINEDEMGEAFTQIAADLSEQYVLSYYPEEDASKPGEFRTIEVTVKGKEKLTVRARKGYYVPKR
ncbi:MAG: VWA domain-containing protein [Pyrinomonadaceae bacterium]|nr:VWA domain-containing protein [Pyrinomonadaceae bacterium]